MSNDDKPDLAALACAALEDARRTDPSFCIRLDGAEGTAYDAFMAAARTREPLLAARTREPLLAAGVQTLLARVEALEAMLREARTVLYEEQDALYSTTVQRIDALLK